MNAYALIIGVDDYTAYDPSGNSNLRGAVNDAAGWLTVAQAVSIPAENTRVLTTRPIPGQTGGASRSEIIAGLEWICQSVRGTEHAKALICFSGHGGWDPEHGSLICPSDVVSEGDRIGNAISAEVLFKHLDARRQLDHHVNAVTLFIDACDAGGAAPQRARTRGLGGPAGDRTGTTTFFAKRTDLLMAASKPGDESFEVPTDAGWRGAFSFAATSVLTRWGTVEDTDGAAFNLTYGDLKQRIDYICGALDVQQRAHFDSVEIQSTRRVFGEERDTLRGTPPVPNSSTGREISPAADTADVDAYEVWVNPASGSSNFTTSNIIAMLYVPGSAAGTPWDSTKVYWYNQTSQGKWDTLKTTTVNLDWDELQLTYSQSYGPAHGKSVADLNSMLSGLTHSTIANGIMSAGSDVIDPTLSSYKMTLMLTDRTDGSVIPSDYVEVQSHAATWYSRTTFLNHDHDLRLKRMMVGTSYQLSGEFLKKSDTIN